MRTILIGALVASCLVACGGVPGDELTKGEERGEEALCTGDGTGACATPTEKRDPILGNWCYTYGGNGPAGTPYPWKVARMSITFDGRATLLSDMTRDGYCYGSGFDFGTDLAWTHVKATFYEPPNNQEVPGRSYMLTDHSSLKPYCIQTDGTFQQGSPWSTDDNGAGQTGSLLKGPFGWIWQKDDVNGNGCHAGY